MATEEKKFILVIEPKDGTNSSGEGAQLGSNEDQEGDFDGAKAYFKMQVINNIGEAVVEVANWAEYFWDEELRLTDDYVGQREKRIAKQKINRVINATGSIFSSTATGAASGGWIGAIVGFVIGTGTQVYKTVSENIKGEREQNIMLQQMEAQLDFTRNRAGWSTQAASIGEDL